MFGGLADVSRPLACMDRCLSPLPGCPAGLRGGSIHRRRRRGLAGGAAHALRAPVPYPFIPVPTQPAPGPSRCRT